LNSENSKQGKKKNSLGQNIDLFWKLFCQNLISTLKR
jgi:hypothetical protein